MKTHIATSLMLVFLAVISSLGWTVTMKTAIQTNGGDYSPAELTFNPKRESVAAHGAVSCVGGIVCSFT